MFMSGDRGRASAQIRSLRFKVSYIDDPLSIFINCKCLSIPSNVIREHFLYRFTCQKEKVRIWLISIGLMSGCSDSDPGKNIYTMILLKCTGVRWVS